MPIPNTLHLLFLELGPSSDAIEHVAFDEASGTWAVEFDDATCVTATWAEAPARLVLEASLGAPDALQKSMAHDAVLAYNALWQHTGGARIGRLDDELILLADAPAELDVRRLLTALENLRNAAAAWSQFIAQPSRSDCTPLSAAMAFTIRA